MKQKLFGWLTFVTLAATLSLSLVPMTTTALEANLTWQLAQKPYFQVPFALPHETLAAAVESFFDFLQEPDSVKLHMQQKISPLHRRGDLGFVHRESSDATRLFNDSKDYFHYHPLLLSVYADFLQEHPQVAIFLAQADLIWQEVYRTAYDLLQAFEGDFPGICDRVLATDCPHIVLRFLRYEIQEAGQYLAKPHFDAGAFTLALAESYPGLRIGTCPQDLALVEHHDGKAIFMLSSNFRKVWDTDAFLPGWHDVVQVDPTALGQTVTRWAVVAFLDAKDVQAQPRSETHRWTTTDDCPTCDCH